MINQKPLPVGIWNENEQIGETKKQFGGLSDQINKVCLSDDLCPVTELFATDENTPDPSNDFIDAFVPQVFPPYIVTNPPFLPPPKNDSFIAPMPFIDFDTEKKDFNIPIIIGLILLGYFILK